MTVNNTQEYTPRIGFVKDSKFFTKYSGKETEAVRFEAISSPLEIDKFKFHFQKLRGEGGQLREAFTIDIYLDKAEALVLAYNILMDKLVPDANGVYYHTAPMGTAATELAARGKSRPSGASEFRQMLIQGASSDKYRYFINAMSCDALMTQQGLFVPQRDQNKRPVNALNAGVPLTDADLRNLASLMITEATAYKAGQWTVNALNAIAEKMTADITANVLNALRGQVSPQQIPAQSSQPQPVYTQPAVQQQYVAQAPTQQVVQPQYQQPVTLAPVQPAQPQYVAPQPVMNVDPVVMDSQDSDVWNGDLDIDTDDLPF